MPPIVRYKDEYLTLAEKFIFQQIKEYQHCNLFNYNSDSKLDYDENLQIHDLSGVFNILSIMSIKTQFNIKKTKELKNIFIESCIEIRSNIWRRFRYQQIRYFCTQQLQQLIIIYGEVVQECESQIEEEDNQKENYSIQNIEEFFREWDVQIRWHIFTHCQVVEGKGNILNEKSIIKSLQVLKIIIFYENRKII